MNSSGGHLELIKNMETAIYGLPIIQFTMYLQSKLEYFFLYKSYQFATVAIKVFVYKCCQSPTVGKMVSYIEVTNLPQWLKCFPI